MERLIWKEELITQKKFCYWSYADGSYKEMMKTCIASARKVGIREDFIVFSDEEVDLEWKKTDIQRDSQYLFKIHLLKELKKLNYDYFIFVDCDTFFVENPGHFCDFFLNHTPVHSFLESDLEFSGNYRKDWWGVPTERLSRLMRENGVQTRTIHNVNAGLFAVKRDFIDQFCDLCYTFWQVCKNAGYIVTEEPPLAYATQMMCPFNDIHLQVLSRNDWASDWTGHFKDRLPIYEEWQFEDYMSGKKLTVKPKIVHAMRSKEAMIQAGGIL